MARLEGRVVSGQNLKPVLKAYGLGYLALTTPRLLGLFPELIKKDIEFREKFRKLLRILLSGWGFNRFPTSCAVLVSGATWLPVLCFRILSVCSKWLAGQHLRYSQPIARLVRFLSAFLSAWVAFHLMNKKHGSPPATINSDASPIEPPNGRHINGGHLNGTAGLGHKRADLAGKTLDLTLFSFTRAASVVVYAAWNAWSSRRNTRGNQSRMAGFVAHFADTGVFAGSAAVVMWAWFYAPERLPRSYAKWIGQAASVDTRLIEALRRVRRGIFVYGKDTGQAPLLEPMCKEYGWPIEWGDPAKTIPIPCEMVHMGCGPSCEWHAVSRFARAFKFSLMTYLPLQLLLRVRSRQTGATITRAVKDALRSSSFLSLFISLFYYSVCLARTRLGPKIFNRKTVTPMMWDAGLCVGAGCFMCGWSILAENPAKRQEVAFFVAPRAAATLLPRRYDQKVCAGPLMELNVTLYDSSS
ncbi:integral membrane protein [Talaromyces proteolyticus]|uniref:Integral membrane protein n=1 Tax=Talaromyces proteolyticus TaxID=1131652 RepID=A0AAD4L4B6_9EURO|nr:uncharacterized protein BGW36DRAFT_17287 [Talaromyces proteolyticus]KAH8705712.1 integral membrane protein [Talaromyces proteolyticus]